MADIDTTTADSEGMMGAIDELIQRFKDGGLTTKDHVFLTVAQRAALAEAAREQAERDKDKLVAENLDLRNRVLLAKRNVVSALKFLSNDK